MSFYNKHKDAVNFIFRLGLSFGLLFYLFSKMDMGKTWEVVRYSDLNFILLSGVTFFITLVIILIRWFIFIRALDLDVPFSAVVRYFFIGLFGNLFLPSSIGGDIIKIYGLCKGSSEKPKVVASVLIDRLSGFASILIVSIFSFAAGYKLVNDSQIMYSMAFLALLSAIGLVVLFNEKVYTFCCGLFEKLPKFKKNLMKIHYDLALLKGRAWEGVKAVGLSCLAQVVLAVTFYLFAKALHQDIKMIYFLIFVPLICVASAAPSIGGLGVREAGAAYLFSKVGVDPEIAVSLSLMNFFFMVVSGLIGGLFYVSSVSTRRVQHNSSDAGVSKA